MFTRNNIPPANRCDYFNEFEVSIFAGKYFQENPNIITVEIVERKKFKRRSSFHTQLGIRTVARLCSTTEKILYSLYLS